jgi:hypothetical protein
MQCEFCRDVRASSAVNLLMTSASFTIACHVDWFQIDPLHVFRSAGTATVLFHNGFDIFHKARP